MVDVGVGGIYALVDDRVGVDVRVNVGVAVAVRVGVGVAVRVGVAVAVSVGVIVGVNVGVNVGVLVGVGNGPIYSQPTFLDVYSFFTYAYPSSAPSISPTTPKAILSGLLRASKL